MKLIKSLFGSKSKKFSKYETNTLAELNESPDLRLESADENDAAPPAPQAEKTPKPKKTSTTTTSVQADSTGTKRGDTKKTTAPKEQKSDEKKAPATTKSVPKKSDTALGDKGSTPKKTDSKPTKKGEDTSKYAEKQKGEQPKKSTPSTKKVNATSSVTTTDTESDSSTPAKPSPKKKIENKTDGTGTKKTAPIDEDIDDSAVTVEESKPTRTGKFEIKKSKDGRYVFNLYASNSVIVATSQVYSSSSAAMNGIKSVITNAPIAQIEDQTLRTVTTVSFPKWEIYRDKAEHFRFRLCASNGSCVCHSQGYTSKANCKKGIESIVKFAADAEITKAYLNKKEN